MHLKITFGSLVLCLVTEMLNNAYVFQWAMQKTFWDAGVTLFRGWLWALVLLRIPSLRISNEVKLCFSTGRPIIDVVQENTGESFSEATRRSLILLHGTVQCYCCSRQLWFRNNHVCLSSMELDERFKLIKCYKQCRSVESNTDSLGILCLVNTDFKDTLLPLAKPPAWCCCGEDTKIGFSHLEFAWKKNVYGILSTRF